MILASLFEKVIILNLSILNRISGNWMRMSGNWMMLIPEIRLRCDCELQIEHLYKLLDSVNTCNSYDGEGGWHAWPEKKDGG